MIAAPTWTVENSAFQVTISIHGGQVHLVLHDRNADFDFANGLYKYKLVQPNKYGSITYEKILDPVVVDIPDSSCHFVDHVMIVSHQQQGTRVPLQRNVEGIDGFQIQVVGVRIIHLRHLNHQRGLQYKIKTFLKLFQDTSMNLI